MQCIERELQTDEAIVKTALENKCDGGSPLWVAIHYEKAEAAALLAGLCLLEGCG